MSDSDLAPTASDYSYDEYEADEGDDDAPALVELLQSIRDHLDALTRSANDLAPIVSALGTAASSEGSPKPGTTPQQLQQWSGRAAAAFEDPANRLSGAGERMLHSTKALDVDMKRLRALAIELLPFNSNIANGYNSMLAQLSGVSGVVGQLDSLLTAMKPAEVLSVPLRNALRPARRGLTRVNDSLRLVETWQPVGVKK